MIPKSAYLLVLALGLIGAGVFFLKSDDPHFEKVEIVKQDTSSNLQTNSIKVDVSGAIYNSGVYEVGPQSRIADVLELAGGVTAEADTEWVESNLNRAQLVVDGQKIFIPAKLQFTASEVVGAETSVKRNNEKISINSASQAELESLPQIGPVTATKIKNNRPYGTLEELVSKKVLSQTTYDKVKDLITLW